MANILLRMEHVSKSFPGVKALDDVSITLEAGSVLGLMGENGAGKSTLMNVLGGICKPDTGKIFIDDQEVAINGVLDAQSFGIAFIHQELALQPHLTIAENIFQGREIKNRLGMISKPEMYKAAAPFLEMAGLTILPSAKVSHLSTGQQQMVEMAKAFSLNARILVMDEPTSSLSEKETGVLFDTVRKLRESGIGIIYISHKMSEIFELTDVVSVMRDGQYIGTKKTAKTNENQLIRMMVGRELGNYYVRDFNEPGELVLEVKNISSPNGVHDCSFSLKKNEVLGFYGLIGAGRSELIQAIMGLDKRDQGEIYLFHKPVHKLNPSLCQKIGLVLVPESRKTQGLILENTVVFNSTLAVLDQFIRLLRVNKKKELELAEYWIKSLNIKTPSVRQRTANLSGGNQQKVVLAKWLATNPRILILDEPTRGVDVGAKAEIYKIINDLAKNGIAVIMLSSELNEVMNMCDRMVVMREGAIVKILDRTEFSQDLILKYAIGGVK